MTFTVPHGFPAVNGAEVPPVDAETVLQLKRELSGIRNKVNALLETLDAARVENTLPTTTDPPAPVKTEKKQFPGTGIDFERVYSFLLVHAYIPDSMYTSLLSSLFPKGTLPFAALVCPLAFLDIPSCAFLVIFPFCALCHSNV